MFDRLPALPCLSALSLGLSYQAPMAAAASSSILLLRGGCGSLMLCKSWPPLHTPSISAGAGYLSAAATCSRRQRLHVRNKSPLLLFSLFWQRSFFSASSSSSSMETETTSFESSTSSPPPPIDSDSLKKAADALDIRVGHIIKAWRHPDAEGLYVEEVDVGEPEPRTICSGLVRYIPLDHLQGTQVVVLANLKPRNMRGVKSNGMLLAASDASHENVELLLAPKGSIPGERIWFGLEEEKENQCAAASANQVQKKKLWELVQPHLKTDDSCVAALGVLPMRTSAGVVVCSSLQNANIA